MPRNSDTRPKPAIVFSDVSKTFNINHTTSLKETFLAAIRRKDISSKFNAVDHVSFEIPEGQSVAIMGRNGSGKSTSLKLLSGVLRPDTGWIRTRGRIAGLLEVGAGFHPDLTGRENVYLNAAILGMTKEETDAKFDDILAFSEIGEFIDTEVKRYSSGMYSRLGFSVAVHTEVDVLLVDEVLSVGDAQFRLKCEAKMLELREQGTTMFIVSHAASQVKKLCERGIVLEKGKIVFDGPIDEAVAALEPKNRGAVVEPLSYPVSGGIKRLWDRSRSQFGRPTGPETEVEDNGAGWYQEFENGLITYSKELGRGHGILSGSLLDAYLTLGGVTSEWGFPTESIVRGNADDVTELPFQHGRAILQGNGEVTFVYANRS